MRKLRNKKTGEIVDLSIFGITLNIRKEEQPTYHSIEQLCEDWEDVKEPLIKDEKIRKAVRAWAEADGADEKIYLTIDDNGSRFTNKYGGYIEFAFQIDMEDRLYTLTELCGDDE